MGLNIKNEETHRIVRELAELTGESQTEAITRAVRERLERIKSRRQPDLTERLLAIGEDCARRFKEPFKSMEHGDFLYDDQGMPK